jgi:hypothetical protein
MPVLFMLAATLNTYRAGGCRGDPASHSKFGNRKSLSLPNLRNLMIYYDVLSFWEKAGQSSLLSRRTSADYVSRHFNASSAELSFAHGAEQFVGIPRNAISTIPNFNLRLIPGSAWIGEQLRSDHFSQTEKATHEKKIHPPIGLP